VLHATYHHSLRHFGLRSKFAVDTSALRPLLHCPLIETFSVNGTKVTALDKYLEAMVMAWPNLRDLTVFVRDYPTPLPTISPQGLLLVANRCTHLCSAYVQLDLAVRSTPSAPKLIPMALKLRNKKYQAILRTILKQSLPGTLRYAGNRQLWRGFRLSMDQALALACSLDFVLLPNTTLFPLVHRTRAECWVATLSAN
jgi:hypothetical protein